MEIQIKLPAGYEDNVEEIAKEFKVKTSGFKNFYNADVEYRNDFQEVEELGDLLGVLFQVVLQDHEKVGTRINDMPYVVTKDNEKNIPKILKKLMR